MSVLINASTTSGLTQTADTSGTLELQSNGTTQLTVSSTGAYGQLKSGTAVASTSGTSIDFTGLPSWVKRITVMFTGVSTSGTSSLLVRLGTSGGLVTSGYDSTASSSNSVGGYANSTVGMLVTYNTAASSSQKGAMTLLNITGNTWVATGTTGDAVVNFCSSALSGTVALGGTLDRVRITTVNGTDTFDAGSINILYEG